MGRVKEYFIDNYFIDNMEDDFTSTANKAFFETSPTYSHMDIDNAIVYAIDGIAVEPSEVGKIVYGYLFREKMYEYLGNPI
jgi:hypothetical protein